MMNCVVNFNIGKDKSVNHTVIVRKHSGNKCVVVACFLHYKVCRFFNCKVRNSVTVSVEFITETVYSLALWLCGFNKIDRYKVDTCHIEISHYIELIFIGFNRKLVYNAFKRSAVCNYLIYLYKTGRLIYTEDSRIIGILLNSFVRVGVLVILNCLVNTTVAVTDLTVAVRTPSINLTIGTQSNRMVITCSYCDYFFYRVTVKIGFNLNREVLLALNINSAFNIGLYAVTELTLVI